MSTSYVLDPGIWTDPRLDDLDQLHVQAAAYLQAPLDGNYSGVWRISLLTLATQLRADLATAERVIVTLAERGLIEWDPDERIVYEPTLTERNVKRHSSLRNALTGLQDVPEAWQLRWLEQHGELLYRYQPPKGGHRLWAHFRTLLKDGGNPDAEPVSTEKRYRPDIRSVPKNGTDRISDQNHETVLTGKSAGDTSLSLSKERELKRAGTREGSPALSLSDAPGLSPADSMELAVTDCIQAGDFDPHVQVARSALEAYNAHRRHPVLWRDHSFTFVRAVLWLQGDPSVTDPLATLRRVFDHCAGPWRRWKNGQDGYAKPSNILGGPGTVRDRLGPLLELTAPGSVRPANGTAGRWESDLAEDGTPILVHSQTGERRPIQ